jgi:hypothetical protein
MHQAGRLVRSPNAAGDSRAGAITVAAHPLTDPTVLFTKRFASKVEEGRRLSRPSAKQIASPAVVGLDDVDSIHRLLTN